MSFHKTTKEENQIKESNFEYITESGIYDVAIKFISVNQSAKGSVSLDFNVEYKGVETTLYGLRLSNNDGSDNFQKVLFNKLCIIAGLDEIAEPEIQSHVVGKSKETKEFSVLSEFTGMSVKIRIQYVYSKYNGEIREQRDIKGFYRVDDGATAAEIVNGTEAGVQLSKDRKYEKSISYKDGLTAEDVAIWKGNKTSKVSSPKGAISNPFS